MPSVQETPAHAATRRHDLPTAAALPSSAVAWTRGVAVASLIGLIALGLWWELWGAPVRPGGSWLALKVLPLLLPLPGLLRHRMYTYLWLSLLVWIYFTEGIVRATSDRWPSAGYAIVESLLCLLLFAACGAHVRWRLKQRAPTPPAA